MTSPLFPVEFNTFLCLKNSNGQYLTSFDRGISKRYNWPKLGNDENQKVKLQLLCIEGHGNELHTGDVIKLKTSESRAGDLDTLGEFDDSRDCYYWKDNYDNEKQGWIIGKAEESEDKVIRYGEKVTLTNVRFKSQKLAADPLYKGYINTEEDASDTWVFEKVKLREPVIDEQGNGEWLEYYERFPEFSVDAVRPGCYPRKMEHENAEKAIVLVHGLTDSPYFMVAIAEHFFNKLKYNVYLPLLQGHGLVIPSGMDNVSREQWQENVKFAIDTAAERVNHISIGGLSTGGTLSCYEAMTNNSIHALYLFSAALDIADGFATGNLQEYALRSGLPDVLESPYLNPGSLIGENPYRYARMDYDGARQLAEQIKLVDQEIAKIYESGQLFSTFVFAAHSESDSTADIGGIEAFRQVCDLDKFKFFRIPEDRDVSHASLVLEEDITRDVEATSKGGLYENVMTTLFDWLEERLIGLRRRVLPESTKTKTWVVDPILEKANPWFTDMMEAITSFDKTITLQSPDELEAFQIQALHHRLAEDKNDKQVTDLHEETAEEPPGVDFHKKVIAAPEALLRYATAAQAVYKIQPKSDSQGGLESYFPKDDKDDIPEQLRSLNCHLIEEAVYPDTKLLNGLQAMCLEYRQGNIKELIIAYQGTETSDLADLMVDAGIAALLLTSSADDSVRRVIKKAMERDKQTPMRFSGLKPSDQIAGRLINARIYLQDQVALGRISLESYNKITVVGHSLGGIIAAHIAYWANEKYNTEVYCHTFNSAPGAKYTLVDKAGSKNDAHQLIANRIINHRIIGDSVSALPPPIGVDSEGFPYAHLGYIYNWRPFKEDSIISVDVHYLARFIDEIKFETKHLVGISPAPIGNVYW